MSEANQQETEEISTDESSEPAKKSKKTIGIIISVIVVVVAIVAGVMVANGQSRNDVAGFSPIPAIEKEEKDVDTDVYVRIVGTDAETIVDADVKIIVEAQAELLKKDTKTVEDTVEIGLNEDTKVATLPKGDYVIHLLSAPITIEGNTFVLPEDGIEFSLPMKDDDESNKITLEIELEALLVEDMSKEQLETVAAIIDEKAPEHADVANGLREKATTAESKPESADDVAQGSAADNGGNTGGNTDAPAPGNSGGNNSGGNTGGNTDAPAPGNSGGNNSGGNTGGSNTGGNTPAPSNPEPPAHTHSWVWYETKAAVPATPGTPAVTENYTVWIFPADGYVAYSGSEAGAHAAALYKSGQNGNSYTEIRTKTVKDAVPGTPGSPAEGYYSCACGATK